VNEVAVVSLLVSTITKWLMLTEQLKKKLKAKGDGPSESSSRGHTRDLQREKEKEKRSSRAMSEGVPVTEVSALKHDVDCTDTRPATIRGGLATAGGGSGGKVCVLIDLLQRRLVQRTNITGIDEYLLQPCCRASS
jgi:hypothetical protein